MPKTLAITLHSKLAITLHSKFAKILAKTLTAALAFERHMSVVT